MKYFSPFSPTTDTTVRVIRHVLSREGVKLYVIHNPYNRAYDVYIADYQKWSKAATNDLMALNHSHRVGLYIHRSAFDFVNYHVLEAHACPTLT